MQHRFHEKLKAFGTIRGQLHSLWILVFSCNLGRPGQETWYGGTDRVQEGVWRFTDGTDVDYVPGTWDETGVTNEDCARFTPVPKDWYCDRTYSFICMIPAPTSLLPGAHLTPNPHWTRRARRADANELSVTNQSVHTGCKQNQRIYPQKLLACIQCGFGQIISLVIIASRSSFFRGQQNKMFTRVQQTLTSFAVFLAEPTIHNLLKLFGNHSQQLSSNIPCFWQAFLPLTSVTFCISADTFGHQDLSNDDL